ncbi:MAG TPA: hypothetical protein VM925_02980 [Labilithrix sp.]|nr:hypothetical protein [Labilithrix sp.]
MPGTILVTHVSPLCLRTRLAGRFDLALANEVMSTVDAWRGTRTGLETFHDCSLLEDYDVAARERVSAWSREHAAAFDAVHLLVHGRTIAWAIKLMVAVSGAKLVSYHSSAAFEAAFAERVGA